MRFGLLGPVEVRHDGRSLNVGSGRERFVLASLLLNADRVTLAGTLIDALWTQPPASCLDRHELDLPQFRRLVERGRQAAADGDHAHAVEERLSAAETLLEAQLALGRNDELLRGIGAFIDEHPYRERLHQTRMLALVGAGQRAEALEHYRRTYRRFADELGVEPGRALREFEHHILQGESPTLIRAAPGPVAPRQLPPASVAPAGRDKLLGEITEILRTAEDAGSPVVLLVGPGGVGKTALALAAAARLDRARAAHEQIAACGREYRALLAALSLDEACLY